MGRLGIKEQISALKGRRKWATGYEHTLKEIMLEDFLACQESHAYILGGQTASAE